MGRPVTTLLQGLGNRLADNRGLNMVEIIVGVQLSAILILLATPIFSQIVQLYNLRGAARAVFADLERARMAAVAANHRYRVVVVDPHTYQLHDDVNGNGVQDAGETVTTRDLQTESPRVQLTAGNAITFAPNGSAPTSGTITVSNETGAARSIDVVIRTSGSVLIR